MQLLPTPMATDPQWFDVMVHWVWVLTNGTDYLQQIVEQQQSTYGWWINMILILDSKGQEVEPEKSEEAEDYAEN